MSNINYDPLNIRFRDLNIGFLVDYDLKTWQIKEGGECDLEGNLFRRFKLSDGKDSLDIFYDLRGKVYLVNEFNIKTLDEVDDEILNKGNPPDEVEYQGKKYYLDKKFDGQGRDLSSNSHDWHRMIAWFFDSEDMKDTLFIGQKGLKELVSFILVEISELDFSNILPSG